MKPIYIKVDQLSKIMDEAEMLESVTGMRPVLFMNRRIARFLAAAWPMEFKKLELEDVEQVRINEYDVVICDTDDGVYVGYKI